MPNGYPQEWVLGGDDIPEEMICTICSELKRDAVKTVCGHSFCADCIAVWYISKDGHASCPLCRAEHPTSSDPTSEIELQTKIDALPSKCPFCPFVGVLLAVVGHVEQCSARPPTRTCQCVICVNTPDVSFRAYLKTLASRKDYPRNNASERLVVTTVPRGKHFFFVHREDDLLGSQGRNRLKGRGAFIHYSSFVRIICAVSEQYFCRDNSKITIPPIGTVFYGVLSEEDAQGRTRVDWKATIAEDEYIPLDEADERIHNWTENDRFIGIMLTQMFMGRFSFMSTPATTRALSQVLHLPIGIPVLARVRNRIVNLFHSMERTARVLERSNGQLNVSALSNNEE